MKTTFKLSALSALCLAAALTVAADGYWNVADGDYGTAGNWDIGHLPLWWESAVVTNGGTVRVSSGVYTNSTIQMFGSNELTNRRPRWQRTAGQRPRGEDASDTNYI